MLASGGVEIGQEAKKDPEAQQRAPSGPSHCRRPGAPCGNSPDPKRAASLKAKAEARAAA